MEKINVFEIIEVLGNTVIEFPNNRFNEELIASFLSKDGNLRKLYDCSLYLTQNYNTRNLAVEVIKTVGNDIPSMEKAYENTNSNISTISFYIEEFHSKEFNHSSDLHDILFSLIGSFEIIKDIRFLIYHKKVRFSLRPLIYLEHETLMTTLNDSRPFLSEIGGIEEAIKGLKNLNTYFINYRKDDTIVLLTQSEFTQLFGLVSSILVLDSEDVAEVNNPMYAELFSASFFLKKTLEDFDETNSELKYMKFVDTVNYSKNDYNNLLVSAREIRESSK